MFRFDNKKTWWWHQRNHLFNVLRENANSFILFSLISSCLSMSIFGAQRAWKKNSWIFFKRRTRVCIESKWRGRGGGEFQFVWLEKMYISISTRWPTRTTGHAPKSSAMYTGNDERACVIWRKRLPSKIRLEFVENPMLRDGLYVDTSDDYMCMCVGCVCVCMYVYVYF